MESKLYRIQTREAVYEDNYKTGEVDGSFYLTPLNSWISKNPKDDIREFAQEYSNDGKIFVDDDIIHVDHMLMRDTEGAGGFYKPTEEDIEMWKAGKINLFNVEYQMNISEMRPIIDDELKEFAKDYIKG